MNDKPLPTFSACRYLFCFLLAGLPGCEQQSNDVAKSVFAATPTEHLVTEPKLNEVSGIADSKANAGHLWVQQDSGTPPDIGLLAHNGTFIKNIRLAGAVNRDWEDMVLSNGPQPGKNYLYIAEIGDNLRVHPDYAIYRLEEPAAAVDTVTNFDRIAFFYPDGSHNAEAILVDPATNDIYIVTKTELQSAIYKLTYPYSTSMKNKAELVAQLPYNMVVSAALSPNGREVIMKTYNAIYYYTRAAGESIVQALGKEPISLPYQQEPQGEAIAFASNDGGFFTMSEKALASSVKVFFYKRQ